MVEVLALFLFLLCRGDCWSLALYLASCVEVVVLERSCVVLTLLLQIPRWMFPVSEVLCGHSENPSV